MDFLVSTSKKKTFEKNSDNTTMTDEIFLIDDASKSLGNITGTVFHGKKLVPSPAMVPNTPLERGVEEMILEVYIIPLS